MEDESESSDEYEFRDNQDDDEDHDLPEGYRHTFEMMDDEDPVRGNLPGEIEDRVDEIYDELEDEDDFLEDEPVDFGNDADRFFGIDNPGSDEDLNGFSSDVDGYEDGDHEEYYDQGNIVPGFDRHLEEAIRKSTMDELTRRKGEAEHDAEIARVIQMQTQDFPTGENQANQHDDEAIAKALHALINDEEPATVPQSRVEPVRLEQCHICLEDMKVEECTFLPCVHKFHSRCIDPWIAENRTCPICRVRTN